MDTPFPHAEDTARAPLRYRDYDFLCVGVHKGGTTWLWKMLEQHPKVAIPLVKELQFFTKKYLDTYYKGLAERHRERAVRAAEESLAAGDVAQAIRYRMIARRCAEPDEVWYSTVFATLPDDKLAGEFSPEYFCLGAEGVAEIHRRNPAGRIVVFIRDPESRMRSAISMATSIKRPKVQLRQIDGPLFRTRGDYAAHVPVWDRQFGDQVLYVPFGDIKTRPIVTLRRIEAHLGLPEHDGYRGQHRKVNSFSGKTEIYPATAERIAEVAKPQRAFLEARFGAEFCARI